MFAAIHPRRSVDSSLGLASKFLPLSLFSDPHALTPSESYCYKITRGEGVSPTLRSQVVTFSPTHRPHKPFSCNTYGQPRKCCKRKTYGLVKSFKCNTYKKHGGGYSRRFCCSPKPLPHNPFADPHPLNLYATILYKNMRGEGALPPFQYVSPSPQAPIPSLLNYLLMSSFASRRFSNGWRNGFVASGATLIAIVISLAAVGKSPVFDEILASAKWLVQ